MIPERNETTRDALLPVLDALPAGLCHVRREHVVYCNELFARLVGRPRAEIPGTNLFDFLREGERDRVRRRYTARQSGSAAPAAYEVEVARPDGSTIRVEIEPKVLGDDELVILARDRSRAWRDSELVVRLTEVGLRLQRRRSEEEVLAEVEVGLRDLGLRMTVARVEGEFIRFRRPHQPAELDRRLRESVGGTLAELRFPRGSLPVVERVIETRRSVFLDDLSPATWFSPGNMDMPQALLDAMSASAGVEKGVVAPLILGDRPYGALYIGADSLTPRDQPTISLFASQIAAAVEVARTISELNRTNRNLEAIHELARTGAEHDLDRVMTRLLETAAASSDSDRSVIYVVDHERKQLELAGCHGATCDAAEQVLPLDSIGVLANVVAEGRPRVLSTDGSMREVMILPLQMRGTAVGVLCLGRSSPRPYREEELHGAEFVAAQLSIQLENARLYSETRRRVDLLSLHYGLSRAFTRTLDEKTLAQAAIDLLVDRLGADAGWLYASRDQRLELAARRDRAGGEPNALELELQLNENTVCGHAALARIPSVVDLAAEGDLDSPVARALGMRHVATFPLLAEDRLAGVLTVARRGGAGFIEEELELLESCAVQLGAAMERTRLFEEERRRAHDLSRINELGGLVAQHLEVPAILAAGVEHLARLTGIPQVFVLLLEPDGGPLRIVASNVRQPGVLDTIIGRDEPSAATSAIRELRPVVIDDVPADPRFPRGSITSRFGQRALLGIPLISRGQPIGAVVLGETREGRSFRATEVEQAVAMANQLAAAIANARLFEEERHRVRELSLLSEIGRIASGTLQREVLLSESLGHVRGSLSFETGIAWLAGEDGLEEVAVQSDASLPSSNVSRELLARLAESAREAGTPICGSRQEAGVSVFACAIPLLAGAEVGGILGLARRQRSVSDAELRTLGAAAPELGVALQNAQLFDEARGRVEELRLLLDVGRAITGSLDLDQILESSAASLARLVDGSNAFILLLDPATRELRGAACSSAVWREQFRAMRIDLDEEAMASRCVRIRAPVIVPDVAASEFANSPRVKLFQEKSFLAVPLLVRGEPIGCVVVDDVRRPRRWTAPEIERTTLIAHQLAVAVANARLYEDLKRSYGELARTQEELVKRERLAALGELSAVVAHEVRNPLGVIFNSLGSIRKLLRPTGDAAMLLEIVEEEADRLDRIVRDLLDFARPHEPALDRESFPDLLRDTIGAVDRGRVPAGVEVVTELPPDLPLVRIDERMIRQALLNLVINGMQSMPRGGTLRVRGQVEMTGPRRWLRIEVADEGTGIPPELATRIFQPFFTTKAAGTGLGLAVVKRFIEAHRGTIQFTSRQGAGTTFTVRLPMDEAV